MRRLTGLILLLALFFGAGWLLQNSQQQAQNAGDPEVFEPARSADESVPPPDVAEGTPALTEPTTAPESPAAGTDVASAPTKPEPEAPAAESETPPAAEAAAPTETAPAEEMASDTPPAADAVPTFDVVRVEPSGDTVIAGLAAPEAKVEVLDGAEPVATAEANERGEWALVLETPLPPGTHDLAIRTTSPDKSVVTLSDQRVAVAVPEKPGEAPLVVLNAPDAPSTVMQVPAEPEVAAAPEMPLTPEAPGTAPAPQASATPEPATPEASTPEPGAPPAAPTETEIASVPPPATEPAPEPAAPTTAPETPAPPTATAPETPPAATPETATTEEPAPSTAAPGPEIATAPPQEEPAPPAAAEPPAPPPVVEEPKPPEPEVGVAAVEAETNGALYIAGTATEPGPVRVYVDDELVGETTPTEGGTWLIETQREMPPGEYKIRADQVEAGSDKVIVRAEVPFEREIEVAVLKQSNESADPGGAEVSGSVAGPMSVIIKRGDNLWRISREMYGHGVRYSTIYQANKDQIRNPNRIYPGQVFMLPQGDTAWQN